MLRIAILLLLFASICLCKTTKWKVSSYKKHVGKVKSKNSPGDDDNDDVSMKKTRNRIGSASRNNTKRDVEVHRSNKKSSKSKRSRRKVILPTRKEPLSSKAVKSWKLLQDQFKTASDVAMKVTTSSTKQALQAAQLVKRGIVVE
jgi:hypothetical protein